MIIALWIINIILALVFLAAGGSKLATSKTALLESGMTWVTNVPPALVKLVGLLEVAGALGLILPLATGIAPILAPIAAVCLTLTMLGTVISHAVRKDPAKAAVMSATLGVLSAISAILGFLAL